MPPRKAFNDTAMSALPKRYFTPEEYLLLEERSPYKSQYIDGEISPWARTLPARLP